jgi:hypothetical protein
MPGADDILIAARSALLDALLALGDHTGEVTIIGAQAIYLHTGAADSTRGLLTSRWPKRPRTATSSSIPATWHTTRASRRP